MSEERCQVLKFEDNNSAGDTLEVYELNGRVTVEVDEPWAGIPETGFGYTCSIGMPIDDAIRLGKWLIGLAEMPDSDRALEADRDAWKRKAEAAEERARFQACAITELKALEAKANRLREIAERKAKAAIEALRPFANAFATWPPETPDAHDIITLNAEDFAPSVDFIFADLRRAASLVSDHDRAKEASDAG